MKGIIILFSRVWALVFVFCEGIELDNRGLKIGKS